MLPMHNALASAHSELKLNLKNQIAQTRYK